MYYTDGARSPTARIWRNAEELWFPLSKDLGNVGKEIERAKGEAKSTNDWKRVADQVFGAFEGVKEQATPDLKILMLINLAVAHHFSQGNPSWIIGTLNTVDNIMVENGITQQILQERVRSARRLLR